MENVKCILSSQTVNGLIFHEILHDLEKSGYQVYSLVKPRVSGDRPDPHDFIIKAEEYGVPQARHRVIILGVRKDINKIPRTLKKSSRVSVGEVINGLPRLRSGLSKHSKENTGAKWAEIIHEGMVPVLKHLASKDLTKKIRESLEKINDHTLTQGGKWTPTPPSFINMPAHLAECVFRLKYGWCLQP